MYAHLLQGLLLLFCIIFSTGWEYELQRMEEGLDEDPFWDISKLKVIRIKKGVYGIDGSIELKADLDDDFTFEIKALHSPKGDSNYQLSPLRLAPDSFCKFLNSQYKNMFMPVLSKTSDFPEIGEDYYCPLPPQKYNIEHYEFDKDTLPDMKEGYYQLQFLFNATKDDRRAQWNVFVKVTEE